MRRANRAAQLRYHVSSQPYITRDYSMTVQRIVLCLTLCFAAGGVAAGEFPALYNSHATAVSPPMTPAEAAAGMKVPPGFHVGVFAAEPQVQNPIAMAWDRRGRMWVAENYTYA